MTERKSHNFRKFLNSQNDPFRVEKTQNTFLVSEEDLPSKEDLTELDSNVQDKQPIYAENMNQDKSQNRIEYKIVPLV